MPYTGCLTFIGGVEKLRLKTLKIGHSPGTISGMSSSNSTEGWDKVSLSWFASCLDGGEGKAVGVEVTTELKVAFSTATVVAQGELSAGTSKAEDDTEEKFSFFLKNSSLLLTFLLLVEGLVRFFPRVSFTLLSLVSKEKEKVELVRLKLKSLPWLANVWQKARH